MLSVSLKGVSKDYRISHEKPALVRQLLPRLIQPLRVENNRSLCEIDLELTEGEALGIVGPNGAGKSTLLSIIAGITRPTQGSVYTRGRVAPLLNLGSGFHPELTGVENIFLNGTLFGMTTHEIRKKVDSIVAFSQLDTFIDTPLQTYSAGMKLRLGFAIAVHVDFDILVVDEVLSVGDTAFQMKCLKKLSTFKRAGKTLVIAAQSTGSLRPIVNRVLLLQNGRKIADGTVKHVEKRYAVLTLWSAPVEEPLSEAARTAYEDQVARHDPVLIRKGWGTRVGNGDATIEEAHFLNVQGHPIQSAESGSSVAFSFRFTAVQPLVDPHLGVAVFSDDGAYCSGPNTRMDGLEFQMLERGTYQCRLRFDALHLVPGTYYFSCAVWDVLEQAPYAYHIGCYPFGIVGQSSPGVVVLDHTWSCDPAEEEHRDPKITVRGPQGEQEWFRTFQPLTLTAVLPSGQGQRHTLRAECRGPKGDLWWATHWSPPAGTYRYQLHLPKLPLLTGRYIWSIGWAPAREDGLDASCAVEVVADRLDHGIIHLAHHWEVSPCL